MIHVCAFVNILLYLILSSILTYQVNSTTQSFIYAGYSNANYVPGTPYESNVKTLLSSFVNSATSASFYEFKVDVVYGLYQCRGDLTRSDCRGCVAQAVGQLGTICLDSMHGAVQLDGCYIKYDNVSFFGTEYKSVVMRRCGPPVGVESEGLTRRDAVLDSLVGMDEGSGAQYFRVGNSGNFHSVAQCVQDLSTGMCQDCLLNATGQLKSECALSARGDVFLAKCYVRFRDNGSYIKNDLSGVIPNAMKS